jgi:hypothetical protein
LRTITRRQGARTYRYLYLVESLREWLRAERCAAAAAERWVITCPFSARFDAATKAGGWGRGRSPGMRSSSAGVSAGPPTETR